MTERTPLSAADREWLAADFALGMAEGDALAEAERLYATDLEFRREVGRWSATLTPLLDDVAQVEPPRDLMPAISRRLPANDDMQAVEARLAWWRAATISMAAVAAGLGGALFFLPTERVYVPSPTAEPASIAHAPMIATMRGDGIRLVANWDGGQKLLVVPVDVAAAPSAKSHELWMIPKDGKPRSMGVLPDGPMMLDVASGTASMLVDGATFAVSLEPAQGSPTGQPTGPVLASGKLVAA